MCPDIVVLSEKLRRPPPRGLRRERLIGPIISADGAPTALVVALAGAGKTTLLAQVAERLSPAVAWYRATGEDRSADAMVAHLVRALSSAGCLPDRAIQRMDDLLGALDDRRGPCAIILDDLHEIRGTDAERALDHFVQLRPADVRVVMGSRSPPLFNLPKLRVSDQIVEIGNEDLRFRSWEVEQLLVDVYREPLPPEPAAALTRKIGGWAAGLQLFHLATSRKSAVERRQAVADLDGRSHFIRSYLASNVLAELSDDKRLFLTRTCTLGMMTAPLCDALLGTGHSAEMLADLEESQLFTSSDDGLSYRYHQVLQEYLESALLEELGPRHARLAYGRSAALLEAAGASHDALRAYARAEDWSAVARMLGQPTKRSPGAAAAWEDLIPTDLRQHDPWFALADARRLVRRGHVEAALGTYRHAAGLLDDPAFQDRCLSERRLVSAWAVKPAMPPVRSEHGARWHWSLRVREALRRATPEPGGDAAHQPTTGDWLAAGLSALVAGDLPNAAEDLHQAIQESENGSLEKGLALLGAAVTDLLMSGSEDAVRRLEEARQSAELGRFEWVGQLAARIHLALRSHDAWRDHDAAGLARIQPGDVSEEDVWGAALNALVSGFSQECAGESGRAHLELAAKTFEALDALVLMAWARAGAALGEAWRGGSAASTLIAAADPDVRRAGAAGPQALLAAAAALSTASPRGRELAVHAQSLAARCGFDPTVLLRTRGTADEVGRAPAGGAASGEELGSAGVKLVCLGGFGLSAGGVGVDLSGVRPRARALLHLLALSLDRDVHREYIVDSLWPGQSLSSATRSLQVNMSSLRQAFEAVGLPGSQLLSRHGDAYRLSLPAGSRADVRDLESGVRQAAALAGRGSFADAVALREEALALYTGDLLPEDGPAEWVVNERERLRVVAAAAAVDQAKAQRLLGDLPAAIRAAQLSLHIYRYGDEAWDLLAELHDEAGNLAEAIRTRQEHARVVSELYAPEDSA